MSVNNLLKDITQQRAVRTSESLVRDLTATSLNHLKHEISMSMICFVHPSMITARC